MKIARVLNVIALGALVGAAVTVYRIKYDATMHAEHAAKLRREIASERDAIQTLRAEWAYLARPDRIQGFAKEHLELGPLAREQTVKLAALPDRPAPVDEIGKKLEALGLMGEDASIAVDTPAAATARKPQPQPPAKKATIAVKPAAELRAPATRPAAKPPTSPKTAAPMNLTDFLKKMGLAQ